MKYGDLIELYFDRSNALRWYWTLYVLVIGGLLAFSSVRQRPDLVTTLLVTILYSFFAYKNLSAIHRVTIERYAILKASKEVPINTAVDGINVLRLRELLEPTLNPPEYTGVRNFHITSDVLTVAAVWAMELRRRRMASVAVTTQV